MTRDNWGRKGNWDARAKRCDGEGGLHSGEVRAVRL